MSELTVPGRPSPTNNPLLVLAGACDNIVGELRKMNEGTHEYALQPTDEEGQTWLVYCIACSNKQQRYVHPCEVKGEHLIPPSTFALAPPPSV
jgi:hypothetical protein